LQSFLFYSLASFLPSIGMAFGVTLDEAIRLPFVFQVMAPLAILWLTWLSRRGTSFQIISVAGCLMNALGIS
ncbi:MFS transporter, partial [Streptococcus pneumoniae]